MCDRRRPLRLGKVEERACCNTRWLTEDVNRGLGRYKRESSGFSRSSVTITPQHHVTQAKDERSTPRTKTQRQSHDVTRSGWKRLIDIPPVPSCLGHTFSLSLATLRASQGSFPRVVGRGTPAGFPPGDHSLYPQGGIRGLRRG